MLLWLINLGFAGSGSGAVVTPEPETITGGIGKGKKRKKRWIVEVANKEFVVESLEEAKHIYEKFQRQYEQEVIKNEERPKGRKKKLIQPTVVVTQQDNAPVPAEDKPFLPRYDYLDNIDITSILLRYMERERIKQEEEELLLIL